MTRNMCIKCWCFMIEYPNLDSSSSFHSSPSSILNYQSSILHPSTSTNLNSLSSILNPPSSVTSTGCLTQNILNITGFRTKYLPAGCQQVSMLSASLSQHLLIYICRHFYCYLLSTMPHLTEVKTPSRHPPNILDHHNSVSIGCMPNYSFLPYPY